MKFLSVLLRWTSHSRGNPSYAVALCLKLLFRKEMKNLGLKQGPCGTFCPKPAVCQSLRQQPGCMNCPDLTPSEPFPLLFINLFL